MTKYVIFATTPGHDMDEAAGTLEELREALINEAFNYNRLHALESFQDQVEAIYPLDDTERDDEAEPLTARPLTKDLITELASHVWDVPESHIEWREDNAPKQLTRAQFHAARHLLGVTEPQYARLLGVGERTIRAWVGGKHPIPKGVTTDVLKLLAEQDQAVLWAASESQRGVPLVYPRDWEELKENYPQWQHKPDGWMRVVLQRAWREHDIELRMDDE